MTSYGAFLAQARSDYRTFEILLAQPRDEVPECHPLHYLQMACEKLAKALRGKISGTPVGRSHVAFSRLARELAVRQDVLVAVGYSKPAETARFLGRATPLFRQLEQLCPSVAGQQAQDDGLDWDQGENAEYPWRGAGDDWTAPADHSFGAYRTISSKRGDSASMLRLVQWLMANFDKIP